MRSRFAIALGGALLIGGTATFVVVAEPIPEVSAPAPVVFVCRNGVAMSVWSAAYFNRLASARGLRERAIARALVPSYSAVPLNMMLALALDGFRVDGYRPRVISADDVRAAELVVAIEEDLPPDVHAVAPEIELWQGFPPMREHYLPSRRALEGRVEALVDRLADRAAGTAHRTKLIVPSGPPQTAGIAAVVTFGPYRVQCTTRGKGHHPGVRERHAGAR